MPEEQALTVVLSARTPQEARLAEWGYEEQQKGVLRSPLPLLRRVWLLVLNDLPPHPHNAFVKLFASREQEREAAFAALNASPATESSSLHAYIAGLQQTLEVKGESDMAEILTPDMIMEIGEKVRKRVLETATPEEKLAGLDPQERLAGMTSAERRELLQLLQEEMDAASGDNANTNGDAA